MKPDTTNESTLHCPVILVQRVAWVCKYCDCVYADEQVSQCDCLGATGQSSPHFIEGKIEYHLPNTPDQMPEGLGELPIKKPCSQ